MWIPLSVSTVFNFTVRLYPHKVVSNLVVSMGGILCLSFQFYRVSARYLIVKVQHLPLAIVVIESLKVRKVVKSIFFGVEKKGTV